MQSHSSATGVPVVPDQLAAETVTLHELFLAVAQRWRLIVVTTVLCAAAALGVAWWLPPVFTATTIILPPQQQGSAASAALSSLGALAGLTGASIRNPAEQYVALMTSTTVMDRIIKRFDLLKVYDEEYRVEARKALAKNLAISVGKKDNLITIEVDDHSPQRATDMANALVEELRHMTNTLAVTEAQQRRVFFESRLNEAKDKLTQAQQALQASGYSPDVLRAEPKAAAEGYGRLNAELMAADIKLQALRRMWTDSAPEVQLQQAVVASLRQELSKYQQSSSANAGAGTGSGAGADYISKFREFKYHETLFDLLSRQYEAARVDESREGAVIQVVDVATIPEKKSKPKRALITVGGALAGLLFSVLWVFAWRVVSPARSD
ncbi:GumC family protein [Sphaerotilus uruguayifluvii]|jgi:uncharacterized protein involved in exopolysaccharide biosynthesis|nr:Wzz/FepE/Etk N-terminal domain-containing protein [Leptothrix sp. C29]